MCSLSRSVIFACRHIVADFPKRFAGHSKWANIRHIKSAKDAQKSIAFTRLSRKMVVAIQEGGSIYPEQNYKLAQIIEQARRINMPTSTIQGVIKNSQLKEKKNCKRAFLEIRGPGMVFLLIELFTDNLNKSKYNAAVIMKKHGVKFSDGSGRHLFVEKGIIETNIPPVEPNLVLEKATDDAIECSAEEVKQLSDDTLHFICAPSSLKVVTQDLEKREYTVKSASVEFIPNVCVELPENDVDNLLTLCEKLENQDDVVKVYDNIA